MGVQSISQRNIVHEVIFMKNTIKLHHIQLRTIQVHPNQGWFHFRSIKLNECVVARRNMKQEQKHYTPN